LSRERPQDLHGLTFSPGVKAGLFYVSTGYIVAVLWHFGLSMLWVLAVALPVLAANRYARARLVDFYLGGALCRRGRFAEALERLSKFLDKLHRKPHLAWLYHLTTFDSRLGVAAVAGFYRAVCLFELGSVEDARKAFESILAAQPQFLECYMNLAGIAVKEGNPGRAADWLLRASPYRNNKFIRIVSNAPFLADVRSRSEMQAVLTPNRELKRRQAIGSVIFWVFCLPLVFWLLVRVVNLFRGA